MPFTTTNKTVNKTDGVRQNQQDTKYQSKKRTKQKR